ncbi:MAG: dTDP-glucose 4,6-dehydratase [Bdellovibrionota bacterium]
MRKILVTGGAGFIGSGFVDECVKRGDQVVVLDLMTYAGHETNLAASRAAIKLVKGDIADREVVRSLFAEHGFDSVVNFAAESHVDRSITAPSGFVHTNVLGVFSLLDGALGHFEKLSAGAREKFRFVHVSTDEVFGALGETGKFSESTPYAPNSPYSASKAGGDHLARAWFHTYKLPVVVTNCSNNYGPRQFPEKLIPHMIDCALSGKTLPVYGKGQNVRDWIHVADHCAGVRLALDRGVPGDSYCFGGNSERKNLDVVRSICAELDRAAPRASGTYTDQIAFVEDRKGHDWRYAIDDSKAQKELGFKRQFSNFEEGLAQTVRWYLANRDWMTAVLGKNKNG